MSVTINKEYKTAYANAVFLSDDAARDRLKSNEELQLSGVAFGDAAALIVDFICGHGGLSGDLSGSDNKTLCDEGGAVIITRDSGYLALCKKIRPYICECDISNEDKQSLLSRTLIFSVDDDYAQETVFRLLESVDSPVCVIAAGDGCLISCARHYCAKKKIDLLAVPLDFSFGKALRCDFDFLKENCYFAFDDKLFESLQKNKIADAVRIVFSKRILFIEMCVNRLIGADFDEESAKKLVNRSVIECGEYFKDYDYKKLVYAILLSEKAQAILPFDNPVDCISEILKKYNLEVLDGEREYLAYKMLVKIYGVFLSSDAEAVKVPSCYMYLDELESILPKATRYDPPSYYCNDELLYDIKKRLTECEKLGGYIEELTSRIPQGDHIIYLIYGGRKTSVELYPSNVKAQSLKLAPLICKGDSLLKLVWACGYFEWL